MDDLQTPPPSHPPTEQDTRDAATLIDRLDPGHSLELRQALGLARR